MKMSKSIHNKNKFRSFALREMKWHNNGCLFAVCIVKRRNIYSAWDELKQISTICGAKMPNCNEKMCFFFLFFFHMKMMIPNHARDYELCSCIATIKNRKKFHFCFIVLFCWICARIQFVWRNEKSTNNWIFAILLNERTTDDFVNELHSLFAINWMAIMLFHVR